LIPQLRGSIGRGGVILSHSIDSEFDNVLIVMGGNRYTREKLLLGAVYDDGSYECLDEQFALDGDNDNKAVFIQDRI